MTNVALASKSPVMFNRMFSGREESARPFAIVDDSWNRCKRGRMEVPMVAWMTETAESQEREVSPSPMCM